MCLLCVCVCVCVQVANSAQPSTGHSIIMLFRALALMQFDVSVLVHPDCVGGHRFALEYLQFVGCTALALLFAVLMTPCMRHPKQHQYTSSRIPRSALQRAGVLASPANTEPAQAAIPQHVTKVANPFAAAAAAAAAAGRAGGGKPTSIATRVTSEYIERYLLSCLLDSTGKPISFMNFICNSIRYFAGPLHEFLTPCAR